VSFLAPVHVAGEVSPGKGCLGGELSSLASNPCGVASGSCELLGLFLEAGKGSFRKF
jgi:hypothetical protein